MVSGLCSGIAGLIVIAMNSAADANLIGMGSGPTLVALATKHLFGSDLALPSGVAVVAAAALGCGALLLLTARKALARMMNLRASAMDSPAMVAGAA